MHRIVSFVVLVTILLLFGALFSSYALLRVSATAWPAGRDELNVPIAVANTAVLTVLSAVIWRARTGTPPPIRRGLLIASVLALAFVALKSVEYAGEIRHGIVPAVSTFVASYYVLTGMHALHVVAGLIANVWILNGMARVGEGMTAGRMRAVTLYWWFVDIVWLFILAFVYLL